VSFKNRDIISINDFSKKDIITIIDHAKKMEKSNKTPLKGKVMASLFFEPSTRTRLSFESSFNRLGGKVITVANGSSSSLAKGETVHDTIKMIEKYADIIVIRHFLDGAARVAAEATDKPVINAGDGSNQHPTQTLLDLYTIKKTQKRISGLKVAMVGDLKYGRTVHSLAKALSLFNCELFLVSPPSLKMPKYIIEDLKEKGIKFSEHTKIQEVVSIVDILYMTRIQKERFPDKAEYEKVKNAYILKKSNITNVKPNLKILHPLPRVNEIHPSVDKLPYAHYFEQAGNGIPIRQALLTMALGK